VYAAGVPPAHIHGPIVLYDGVCALCNRFVEFVLARDAAGFFRFASLQSELARTTIRQHGGNPEELSSLVLIRDPLRPTERLLYKSDAALFVLKNLPGAWKHIAAAMSLFPAPLRNIVYDMVARKRYRTFGKYDVCPMPPPAVRERFLDR
jgi:predicted DCC family thiol-disulfide oxidoreductase YuxK